ncbi:MAG: hypothetical protein ABSH26_13905 [Opitutaceae bacterium]|jgi:hypothetical protein
MRAPAVLLLVLGGAAAQAGDPPAAAGDPLAAARRDFASIKPAPATAEAGAGPAFTAAKADGAAGEAAGGDAGAAAAAGLSTVAPPGGKGGTGNWLLDAMEQKGDRPRALGGTDDLVRGDLDLLRAADGADRRESGPSQAGERSAPGALAASVYNPLDAFMSGWVSPRDRDLLLPSRGDNPLGGAPGAARAQLFSGPDLGQLGAPAGSAPGDLRAPGNPYVADLNLGPFAPARAPLLPDIPGFAPLELPDLSHGMSVLGAGTAPLDSARSAVPDFALPPDDDKYFKQLKRF